MGDVYLSFDFVAALLAAGALAMVAFAHRELRAARMMFAIAAIVTSVRWVMWAFETEVPWWVAQLQVE
jgi:hypothetical protein